MSTSTRIFTEADGPALLSVPLVASIPLINSSLRRVLHGGCGGCHGTRTSTANIGQLLGPALAQLARTNPDGLYRALARVYNIHGPITVKIGCCNTILQEPQHG